jgi:hypothetical protein
MKERKIMLSGQEKTENMQITTQTTTQPTGLIQHFKYNWHRYGMWTLGTACSLGVDFALGAPVTSIFHPITLFAASTLYGLPAAVSTVAYDKIIEKNDSKKRKHQEIVEPSKSASIQTADVAEFAVETTPTLLFQAPITTENNNTQNDIDNTIDFTAKKVSFEDEESSSEEKRSSSKAKRRKVSKENVLETDIETAHVEQDASNELKENRKVRRSTRKGKGTRKHF